MAQGKSQEDRALQRAQFRKALSRLSPKQRVDALISETRADRAVQGVPAEELYQTVLEVGLADTTEIVQLAAPKQFRTFVDLGAWKKDELDEHALITWLRAAHGDDEEQFMAKVDALDFEVFELLLRRTIEVHDLEENPDANPAGVTMESPEGKYLIEFKIEGPEQAAVKALLMSLIARDPFAAGRIFEAIRWEVDSELLEEAYRFRAARLQDLGFPELYDALSLFAYVDPHKAHSTVTGANDGPSAIVPSAARIDYLARALTELTEHERERADEELRHVVNQALVAEGADPGDLAAMRRVAELCHDYLSLGIEHLSNGSPDKAVEVVRDVELKRIFQIGFSLTLKLKFRVDRLAKLPLARLWDVWLMLAEETAVVTALARKRPLKAVKVPGAEPMPFRARRELQEIALVVDRAEGQLAVFGKLLGGTRESAVEVMKRFDAPLPVLGTNRLLAAAVAHAVMDGAPTVQPFAVERFNALIEQVVRHRDDARAKALTAFGSYADAAVIRSMVDTTLSAFDDEWRKVFLANGTFDPNLVLALPLVGVKTL